jgi:hypothetical protein
MSEATHEHISTDEFKHIVQMHCTFARCRRRGGRRRTSSTAAAHRHDGENLHMDMHSVWVAGHVFHSERMQQCGLSTPT